MVEPLLTIAADLEARDARVAEALARVEAERAEVDALRARAVALIDLLAWLPQARSENECALHEAKRREDDASAAYRAADDDDARRVAALALAAAEAEVARYREHREAFLEQERQARAEAEQLGDGGLDATVEALSHRRGALLVEHSNLAREREAIVREASELLGSVLGDPFAATSVAGLRARLP